MIKKTSFFGFDLLLFGATLFLMIIGIIFIYSSGISDSGELKSHAYEKQIIWVISGLVILIVFAILNHSLLKSVSYYIYFLMIILIGLTYLIGKEVNGAKSWLGFGDFGIQPSEFAKISTIIALANFFTFAGKKINELPVVLSS